MKPTPLPNEWFVQNRVDAVYTRTSEQLADPLLTKFTGIDQTSFSFYFLQKPGQNILLCSPLEAGTVKQRYEGKISIFRTRKDVLKHLRKFFSTKNIGINERYLTGEQVHTLKKTFSRAKFVDVSESLYQTREIKTREELKTIKEAVKITQDVVKKIPNMMKPGISEIQLGAEIEHAFAREGCPPSFPTIVAFGKNSRNIHHFNTHKKIGKGENVLVDCGAKYSGYCADLSRTFVYKKANDEQNGWYEKCVAAQNEAFKTIKPTVHAKHSMEVAEKMLGRKIPHALGHGIGLETHDVPGAIHRKAEWVYKQGMAVAIEPGYYGEKWGMRIEDDAIVTKNGNERLSFAPKRLIEI
jgi:Xaa-Pro aminopeptidase